MGSEIFRKIENDPTPYNSARESIDWLPYNRCSFINPVKIHNLLMLIISDGQISDLIR